MPRFTLFAFLALLPIASLQADTLKMKNGDVLSGELLTQTGENADSDGKIEFKTPYADDPFLILWNEVAEIHTDKPITVLMKNGDVLEKTKISETEKESGTISMVKPEEWRTGKGWKFVGLINTAIEFERGNNDSDEFDFDGNILIRDKNDRFTVYGELENDKVNGDKSADNWEVRPEYNRFLNKRLYTGATASGERDKFADLNSRATYGPLLGYQFYETARMNMKGSGSFIRVNEDYESSQDRDFWATGWNFDFDYFILMDKLQFYHRNLGFWNVEDTEKVILQAWTGLRWPIYRGIVGSLEYQIDYDSEPADEAKDYDSTFAMKLGYQW